MWTLKKQMLVLPSFSCDNSWVFGDGLGHRNREWPFKFRLERKRSEKTKQQKTKKPKTYKKDNRPTSEKKKNNEPEKTKKHTSSAKEPNPIRLDSCTGFSHKQLGLFLAFFFVHFYVFCLFIIWKFGLLVSTVLFLLVEPLLPKIASGFVVGLLPKAILCLSKLF